MFLLNAAFLLRPQRFKRHAKLLARILREYDLVDKAVSCRDIGIQELGLVFGHKLFPCGRRILGLLDITPVNDVHGAIRAHDSDLRDGPGKNVVRAYALAVHGDVGAPKGLAHNKRNLRDGRLGIGVKQLRPVPYDAQVFLLDSGHVPRDIDKGKERDVEAIAEADETSRLVRGIDIQGSRQNARLVGHDAYDVSLQAGKTRDNILCKIRLNFKEASVIYNICNNLANVVFSSVSGAGTFEADVLNLPEDFAHTVAFDAAGGCTQLKTGGNLTLPESATLTLSFPDGFKPETDRAYRIIDAAALVGTENIANWSVVNPLGAKREARLSVDAANGDVLLQFLAPGMMLIVR